MKADVALLGVVMEPPAPDTMLQAPVPLVGAVAAKVAEVPQMDWSSPATAGETLTLVTFTSSCESAQAPFGNVHLKVFNPAVRPVTPVV